MVMYVQLVQTAHSTAPDVYNRYLTREVPFHLRHGGFRPPGKTCILRTEHLSMEAWWRYFRRGPMSRKSQGRRSAQSLSRALHVTSGRVILVRSTARW